MLSWVVGIGYICPVIYVYSKVSVQQTNLLPENASCNDTIFVQTSIWQI